MYYDSDQIIILGGDHLYRMDYGEMVRFHRETGADITLGVYPVVRDEASRMGLMKADADGRVLEFVEKPTEAAVIDRFRAPRELFQARGMQVTGDKYLASMGIYVFKPAVLRELLQDTNKTDFGKEVIPDAIEGYKVMGFPFSGYWRDIGTIGAFFEANLDLVKPDPEFNLYKGGWPFYTRSRSLPPSRVINSEIKDSLIVEGSSVTGATIINSIIGVRSLVGAGSHLKDVIIMGNDFYEGERQLGDNEQQTGPALGVGRNCLIERCIIDKNARIGDNVVIRAQPDVAEYEGKRRWVRDGITVIPKGAVIQSGTVL
jgi:glucose-1-phosphate adenylyltransferase